jgi:hypothetical protein
MFNTIHIKFKIGINNNEILKTKWEHNKKKKKGLSLLVRNNAKPKLYLFQWQNFEMLVYGWFCIFFL